MNKPTTGLEPVAYHLQGGCSTIELRRHTVKTRPPLRRIRIIPNALITHNTGQSIKIHGERQFKPSGTAPPPSSGISQPAEPDPIFTQGSRLACGCRAWKAAYNTIEPATAAFIDSTCPRIGRVIE